MKVCLLIGLATLVSATAIAQQSTEPSIDSLIQDYYESLHVDHGIEDARILAEQIRLRGIATGDKQLETRGLVRLAYAELVFDEWNDTWRKQIQRCQDICGTENSIARAELLMFHGHMKGKWLGDQDGGFKDIKEAIWIAGNLREDLLLCHAYVRGGELLNFQQNLIGSRDFGLRAIEIGRHIQNDDAIFRATRHVSLVFRGMGLINDSALYASQILEKDPDNFLARYTVYLASEEKDSKFESELETELERLGALPQSRIVANQTAIWQQNLAKIKEAKGDYDSAIALIDQAKTNFAIAKNTTMQEAVEYSKLILTLKQGVSDDKGMQKLADLVADPAYSKRAQLAPEDIANLFERIGEFKLALVWKRIAQVKAERLQSLTQDQAAVAAQEFWQAELRNRHQTEQIESQRQTAQLSYLFVSSLITLGLVLGAIAITRMRVLRKSQRKLERLVSERTESLRMALERAEVADNAKNDFLARVNHELRNPLTAILGYCELVESVRADASGPLNEYLSGLNTSSRHLLDLVDDVLELAKIENGHISSSWKNFNLGTVCTQARDVISEMATEKRSIEFQFSISPECDCEVFGDHTMFRQILINLLSNAIRYTAKGFVSLTVTTEIRDSKNARVTAVIADSGIGIPESLQQTVFEPFSQVSNNRQSVGNGLGLYITKSLVERLGGRIELESTVDVGTTVSIDIPFTLAKSAVDATDDPGSITIHPLPEKILVVDDKSVIRDVVCEQLRNVGRHAKSCSSLAETLNILEIWKPKLLLLDLRMPDDDGFQILKTIQENDSPTPVIIAMTGDATDDVRKRSIDAGFDGFLTKPFRVGKISEIYSRCRS